MFLIMNISCDSASQMSNFCPKRCHRDQQRSFQQPAVFSSCRDRYVSDEEYLLVWTCAHPTVQDAMDLALLTGQRPADVLKIALDDIDRGSLFVTQNKTGKKLRISIEGDLAEVLT